jgi:pimeloyl-ACP methyl ester carboxylesterase
MITHVMSPVSRLTPFPGGNGRTQGRDITRMREGLPVLLSPMVGNRHVNPARILPTFRESDCHMDEQTGPGFIGKLRHAMPCHAVPCRVPAIRQSGSPTTIREPIDHYLQQEKAMSNLLDEANNMAGPNGSLQYAAPPASADMAAVRYRTLRIDGVDMFYREAGDPAAPTLLLLHGFPTSSHMFRNLIPLLADRYHLVAPDYPGYGQSDAPPVDQFDYSFDHLAQLVDKFTAVLGLDTYALYVQDYGAPVGFRLAAAHPERVNAIVVQNGNAYDEGLDNAFWAPIKAYWSDRTEANAAKLRPLFKVDATRWQYSEGMRNPEAVSPDAWMLDQAYMDRPGNSDIQLALLHSYGSNPGHYPAWQRYFRDHQPPMLIAWGKNDKIFPAEGAHPYLRDLPHAELHLLDTGHFALEEEGARIAALMRDFLGRVITARR